jgi:hypothetical protein
MSASSKVRAMRREEQSPTVVERLARRRGVQAWHFRAREVVRINEHERFRIPLPHFVRERAHERKLAARKNADRIPRNGRWRSPTTRPANPSAVRVKLERHFVDIVAHEPLRFQPSQDRDSSRGK